jgi:hypothetical protein
MYSIFHSQFLMFSYDQSANAEFLHDDPRLAQVDWWSAEPLTLPLTAIPFVVSTRVQLFDNYPTIETGIALYSQRLRQTLTQAGVCFQAIPAPLFAIETQTLLSNDYAVVQLLERYPAIDTTKSRAGHIELRASFLHQPRPMFHPNEAPTAVLISDTLRGLLEQAGITGCLYEPLESVWSYVV